MSGKQLAWNLYSSHESVTAAVAPSGAPGAPVIDEVHDAALLLQRIRPARIELDVPLKLLEKVTLPHARTKCSAPARSSLSDIQMTARIKLDISGFAYQQSNGLI